MPFIVTMPKLSPTMEEGTIIKWHKKVGDFVKSGELLLEIATDKATVEHQALDEGWLRQILIAEGNSGRINQPIALFTEQEKESFEAYLPKETPPPPVEEKREDGVGTEERVQTQPTATPMLGQPRFVPEAPLAFNKNDYTKLPQERLLASPLARRLAKEENLDLTTVKGSGPGGRITSQDLQKAQPLGLVTFGKQETPELAPGSYEELPLSPIRKIIARRLQESKTFIPHFYVKQKIDAQPMVALREQLKIFHLHVTFNDIILRACALALRLHPEVNRGFNSVNQTLIQFKTVDIAVAVTVEGGLITPIIRHADYKNLGQLSTEMRLLSEKAKKFKLKEEEYKGGSFCLSNLGMYGITEFTAVINPPQAVILAIGAIEEQPVIKEGKIIPGKTLLLNLSADHRVIDGALAAQFMKTVQKLLENPTALTL